MHQRARARVPHQLPSSQAQGAGSTLVSPVITPPGLQTWASGMRGRMHASGWVLWLGAAAGAAAAAARTPSAIPRRLSVDPSTTRCGCCRVSDDAWPRRATTCSAGAPGSIPALLHRCRSPFVRLDHRLLARLATEQNPAVCDAQLATPRLHPTTPPGVTRMLRLHKHTHIACNAQAVSAGCDPHDPLAHTHTQAQLLCLCLCPPVCRAANKRQCVSGHHHV